MKLSEQEKFKKITADFTRAVRAMRALNEHSEKVKVTFGADDILPGVHPHALELEPGDGEYGHIVAVLRTIARRRVGELSEQLREMGVDTSA